MESTGCSDKPRLVENSLTERKKRQTRTRKGRTVKTILDGEVRDKEEMGNKNNSKILKIR